MATDVTMPQLGESVVEGTIAKWLRAVGDKVEKFDPLVEIVTDKVTVELPSPVSGTITQVLVQEGETVQVGALLATIDGVGGVVAPAAASPAAKPAEGAAEAPPAAKLTEGAAEAKPAEGAAAAPPAAKPAEGATETPPAAKSAEGAAEAPPAAKPAEGAAEAPPAAKLAEGAAEAKPAEAAPPAAQPGEAIAAAPAQEEETEGRRATPAVRRLAKELGVDLAQLKGTGTGGRVTKEDVEGYAAQRTTVAPAKAPEAVPAGGEAPPVTAIRRIIAQHMVRSKMEIPHALTVMEVDMTPIVRFRTGIREHFRQREGMELSYVAFVLKAVVEGLRAHPVLNSAWLEDRIVQRKEVNVGIAVAFPDGLIVPVIHGADGLSIAGLNRAINDLVARAREGKLSLAEVQGGTFTLNNTGSFGSVIGYPIINHPQAAILNMEAIVKRPVVVEEDAIAVRSMMYLCLSFDHRILDGAVAGRFLGQVKGWLEGFGPNVPIY